MPVEKFLVTSKSQLIELVMYYLINFYVFPLFIWYVIFKYYFLKMSSFFQEWKKIALSTADSYILLICNLNSCFMFELKNTEDIFVEQIYLEFQK